MIDWINSIFGQGFLFTGDGYLVIGNFYFEYPTQLPQLTPLSFYFIFFVFIVFCLVRPFKGRLRPYFLLLASLFFLYTFSLYHLVFLCILAVVGWLLAYINQIKKNKIILFISVFIIVGVLSFYKFSQLTSLSLLMPLGLSFVSFKIISSIVDAYKGKIDVKNPLVYLNYALFFPTIIAGPIHRYEGFAKTITTKQEFDYRDAKNGGFQMMLGIFEKLVFCDFVASVVNRTLSSGLGGQNALLAIVLYSFQIYLDFDAYSNISIGCARLLGFSFPKNFNSPYLSVSIKDFWRNWHISLGAFFREYVYIPLGGNRKGKVRQYLGIIIVFLLSGLWHGVTLNFVLWGLGHALLFVIEESIFSLFKNIKINKVLGFVLRVIGIAINFVLVTALWQLFRYSDLSQISEVIKSLSINSALDFETIGLTHNEVIWLICVIVITIIFDILRKHLDMLAVYAKIFIPFRWVGYLVLIAIFLVFGVFGGSFEASDFIYQWF